MSWEQRFYDPIILPGRKPLVTLRDAALYITKLPKGRQLVTLEDAARYIQKLPKAEQQIEEWQTAVEALILVAESNGGPTMLARIGVMQALNRHVERVFNPDRKDHHWGKRKLKRDQ